MKEFGIVLFHVHAALPSIRVDEHGFMYNLWSEDHEVYDYQATQEWLDEFHPLRVYERYPEEE